MSDLPEFPPAFTLPQPAERPTFSVVRRTTRLTVVKPPPKEADTDPLQTAKDILRAGWHLPENGAHVGLIWETVDFWAARVNKMVAKTGKARKGGEKVEKLGGEPLVAGLDYAATQGLCWDVLEMGCNLPLHNIWVSHTHEKTKPVKEKGSWAIQVPILRGFGTVGNKHLAHINSLFGTGVVSLEVDGMTQKRSVLLDIDGITHSKLRGRWPGEPKLWPLDWTQQAYEEFWQMVESKRAPDGYISLGLHGDGGSGKTLLATTILSLIPGRWVYVAYDPRSEDLQSTWPELVGEEEALP